MDSNKRLKSASGAPINASHPAANLTAYQPPAAIPSAGAGAHRYVIGCSFFFVPGVMSCKCEASGPRGKRFEMPRGGMQGDMHSNLKQLPEGTTQYHDRSARSISGN